MRIRFVWIGIRCAGLVPALALDQTGSPHSNSVGVKFAFSPQSVIEVDTWDEFCVLVAVLAIREIERKSVRTGDAMMIKPVNRIPPKPSEPSVQDHDDTVRMMLIDIGRIPMLTAAEELRLARKVQRSKLLYRRELLRHPTVARAGADVLEDVLHGRIRADRALQVSLAKQGERDRLFQIIELNLPTINDLLSRSQDGPTSRSLGSKLALLFQEVGLHTSQLSDAFMRLDVECQRVERAMARYHRYRNRMVAANLRLAVSVAKKFSKSSVPMIDLIQEGSGGLMRAAEKFDPDRGFKFSTYAVWWIRQRISAAAFSSGRLIRVSEGMLRQLKKLAAEATEQLQLETHTVNFEQLRPKNMTHSRKIDLRRSYFAAREIVSLDTPTGTDDRLSASAIVEESDEQAVAPLIRAEQRTILASAIAKLSSREREVIRLRFGLGCSHNHTLAEAGDALKLSRERIRQLEKNGLRKLRIEFEHIDADSILMN